MKTGPSGGPKNSGAGPCPDPLGHRGPGRPTVQDYQAHYAPWTIPCSRSRAVTRCYTLSSSVGLRKNQILDETIRRETPWGTLSQYETLPGIGHFPPEFVRSSRCAFESPNPAIGWIARSTQSGLILPIHLMFCFRVVAGCGVRPRTHLPALSMSSVSAIVNPRSRA